MPVSILHNPRPELAIGVPSWAEDTGPARDFQRSLPGGQPTPLVELPHLARYLGLDRICVKDESERLGLGAFKVLGAAYAIARLLAERLGLDRPSFRQLAEQVQRRMPDATLVTATDGNHGKGVAWVARQLGLRAVVYLPSGAAPSRLQAIRELQAEAVLTDLNYDNAVRLARRQADEQGWLLVQDTAWPGYEQVPAWIMQGYATMAAEADEALQASGAEATHLFLQAGVGSMAASVQGYWLTRGGEVPTTVIVEPERAACFYRSMRVGDGQAHAVAGDLATIMAGLACGEPNPLAWPLLSQTAAAFASCPDYVAALGMRLLAHPLGDDPQVEAGESGAVGLGLLALLMRQPALAADRQCLGLSEQSTVLLFNTEGATDPVNYRKVVWENAYPSPIEF
jgi:diaminopropionate ammonia-lyase